jgi:hypothetical protein
LERSYTTSDEKIVSLKDFKKNQEKQDDATEKQETQAGFDEIIRKNKENQERVKREREKSNKGVIRSYRLKH